MKRIAICCDGTWNELDSKHSTNVVKAAEAISPTAPDGTLQSIFYEEGVGTGSNGVFESINRRLSGMFGWGLLDHMENAYRYLVFNYEPGDEIFIFGFSRGAFTARSLGGLIRNCGILSKGQAHRIGEVRNRYKSRSPGDHPDADDVCRLRYELNPSVYINDVELDWRRRNVPSFDPNQCAQLKIKYMGIWDTVGAMGIPSHLFFSHWFNNKYRFHDAKLSSMVENARHAVATDERRCSFKPTLWENFDLLNKGASARRSERNYQQAWFLGDHTSVGGGGHVEGLANSALAWIVEGAQSARLAFSEDLLERHYANIDHFAPLLGAGPPAWHYLCRTARDGPQRYENISSDILKRWHASLEDTNEAYRPKSLSAVAGSISEAAP